jgi:hypothetical protein
MKKLLHAYIENKPKNANHDHAISQCEDLTIAHQTLLTILLVASFPPLRPMRARTLGLSPLVVVMMACLIVVVSSLAQQL